MPGQIHLNQAQRHQLTQNGPPGAIVVFLADPVSRDAIVPELCNPFILRAQQYADDIGLSKRSPVR